jgi:hypothetical protein
MRKPRATKLLAAARGLAAAWLLLCVQSWALAAPARVVGIQIAVSPSVYRDRAAFERRLEEAVSAAVAQSGRKKGEQLVLVLPEHLGTFLSFLDEMGPIYSAPSRPIVASLQVLGNPAFMGYHLRSAAKAREPRLLSTYFVFSNLLRYKAESMWTAYTQVFSALAKRHRAIVVAGSICVPRPEDLGKLLAPIYGTSAIFGPDGAILGITRKVHPVLEETMFLTPSPVEDLKPIETPAGRIGILICSDSWFEDTYKSLRDADLLAIPSIGEGGHEVFPKGLKGFKDNQLDLADSASDELPSVLQLLMKHGAPGRIGLTRAVAAVQPLLTGSMWDLETGGPGLTVRRAGKRVSVEMVPSVKGQDTFLNYLWRPAKKNPLPRPPAVAGLEKNKGAAAF